MPTITPSAKTFRQRLAGLTDGQLRHIAKRSGVGFTTVRRVALGLTPNPGIQTCHEIDFHIDAVRAEIPARTRNRKKEPAQKPAEAPAP